MEVLILGGTGAMGVHLTNILENKGCKVTVTTRRSIPSTDKVRYIQGNAMDDAFFEKVCDMKMWDAIVDFMVYDSIKLKCRIGKFLDSTKQYVFISSARVYADSPDALINENSARLLDVCKDEEYLLTDEYALAKAREENVLFNQNSKNWTIIRPSLTYSENRLQLGVYEKENWLYRAMHGRSIVFSKDLLERFYTLSYGRDVADGIASVIGRKEAYGEAIHPVIEKSYQWKDILDLYVDELEQITGKRPEVKLTEKCTNLDISGMQYQVKYGRYFSRHFDNSKIKKFADTEEWLDTKDGLSMSLRKFMKNPRFNNINWIVEACIDRAVKEKTPLSEIPSLKEKIFYLLYRYRMEKIIEVYQHIKKFTDNCNKKQSKRKIFQR